MPRTDKNAADAARYFAALKRISQYQSPDRMRKSSQKDWGLGFEETLEYAYENVIQEARNAIRGKRPPKVKSTT